MVVRALRVTAPLRGQACFQEEARAIFCTHRRLIASMIRA